MRVDDVAGVVCRALYSGERGAAPPAVGRAPPAVGRAPPAAEALLPALMELRVYADGATIALTPSAAAAAADVGFSIGGDGGGGGGGGPGIVELPAGGIDWGIDMASPGIVEPPVGQCRLAASKPVLKAPMVSALKTII